MSGGNLVIDLQRRHAEVFRIRLGSKNQRGYPEKLTDAIRVTSRGADVVAAFTRVYGGEVRPWDNNGDPQHEAFLPTTALHVMILPGQSIFQRWEKYARSVCERRCNGAWEEIEGRQCVCPEDVEARIADRNACNIMTRINVICPDVEVVGAGSLVSHGLIAAETLPQSVAIAETALSRGVMVPAVLRTIEHKGKNHYVVPSLEIVGVSLNQLETGEVPGRQVGAGAPVSIGGAAPRAIGAATQAGGGSLPPLPGEVDAEIVDDHDSNSRGGEGVGSDQQVSELVSNDPTPAPATTDLDDLAALMKERGVGRAAVRRIYNEQADRLGLDGATKWDQIAPGPALDATFAEIDGAGEDPDDPDPASAPPPAPKVDGEPAEEWRQKLDAEAPFPDSTGAEPTLPLSAEDPAEYTKVNRRLQKRATEATDALNLTDRDLVRRTCAWDCSNGSETSWKQLTGAQLRRVEQRLDSMVAGTMRIRPTDDPRWPEGWQTDMVQGRVEAA